MMQSRAAGCSREMPPTLDGPLEPQPPPLPLSLLAFVPRPLESRAGTTGQQLWVGQVPTSGSRTEERFLGRWNFRFCYPLFPPSSPPRSPRAQELVPVPTGRAARVSGPARTRRLRRSPQARVAYHPSNFGAILSNSRRTYFLPPGFLFLCAIVDGEH